MGGTEKLNLINTQHYIMDMALESSLALSFRQILEVIIKIKLMISPFEERKIEEQKNLIY